MEDVRRNLKSVGGVKRSLAGSREIWEMGLKTEGKFTADCGTEQTCSTLQRGKHVQGSNGKWIQYVCMCVRTYITYTHIHTYIQTVRTVIHYVH